MIEISENLGNIKSSNSREIKYNLSSCYCKIVVGQLCRFAGMQVT